MALELTLAERLPRSAARRNDAQTRNNILPKHDNFTLARPAGLAYDESPRVRCRLT